MRKFQTVIASLKEARQSMYMRLLRRLCLLAMTMIIVFLITPSISYANPFAGPFNKLKRGGTKVLVFPAEVPKHMIKAAANARPEGAAPFHGIFYGIPKGLGYGVTRLLSGVVDIVTFPLNIPKNWGELVPVGPFSFGETKESILSEP